MFYGSAGVGKTTAAINFPRPYLIDTEKGAVNDGYIEILEDRGGAVFQTSDFDELVTEVKALLTEKHEFKTLVIDPLTTVYNDLLDKASLKVGTEFGRHYGEANKQMKHLCNLLLRLDMNVIITSHAKVVYGDNLSVIGNTYDCYKKLDYIFDLVFEIQKRGESRVAVIKKSRVKTFEDNSSFTFNYDEVSKKYGKKYLERDAVAEVLATEEQVLELKKIINLLKVDGEVVQKWLKKADSETIEEMNSKFIQKCIDYLKSKIEN